MKILIVDDEPEVASRLADGVGRAGIGECFFAASAEEAIAIVNREQGVDLLVTEVFMDGVDGLTLNEALRESLPNLRTIFVSEFDLGESSERVGDSPVLAKPVEAEPLADFIREFAVVPAASAQDPLVGTTLGNYRVESLLGRDVDGNYYHAVQASIDRAAELHALDMALAQDPAAVEQFLADARLKANVHHPALLSVFEAGQQDGVYFYTSEVRNGSSLATLAAQGARLDPRCVLQLLHSVAEVMVHLGHGKIAHAPLEAEHVIVDHRMRTRVVNTATSRPVSSGAQQEMQALAAMLGPVLAVSESSLAVEQLLFEMGSESVTLRSWNALLYEVKRCASGAPSPHSHRLDASGRAAIEAVGAARKRQRTVRRAIAFAIVLAVMGGGGYAAWRYMQPTPPPPPASFEVDPALESMTKIPGGEFVFDGEAVLLPEFWIDTHEVSIGQYAKFLAWIDAHPGQLGSLLENVPAEHSFVPEGWADETLPDGAVKPGYYAIAQAGGEYGGARLSQSSPVFGVDWFGAQAYAKWKGRRLPTVREWQRAALGLAGGKYPWGDEWVLGNANISSGDAFPKWAPVDAVPGDRSRDGVQGMAGNVSEWTSTAGEPAAGSRLAAGGNWSDALLEVRRTQNLDASKSLPTVGFRTVTDQPPKSP